MLRFAARHHTVTGRPISARHQSTVSWGPLWRQFIADVEDAERRGVLKPRPSPLHPSLLWRTRQLIDFYSTAFALDAQRVADQVLSASTGRNIHDWRSWRDGNHRLARSNTKRRFKALLPIAPIVLPVQQIPRAFLLPAQAARLDAWQRAEAHWPTRDEAVTIQRLLRAQEWHNTFAGDAFTLPRARPPMDLAEALYAPLSWGAWRGFPLVVNSEISKWIFPRVEVDRITGVWHWLDRVQREDACLRRGNGDPVLALSDEEVAGILSDRGLRVSHMAPRERRRVLQWWLLDEPSTSMEQMIDKALSLLIDAPPLGK